MNDLLIVGRGPSILDFDDWDIFLDVMAVSSGIFAIPERARPPKHFATMDRAKWFLDGLHEEEVTHAWQNDGHIAPWPFWKYAEIVKHVPDDIKGHGGYRTLPDGIWDVIPEKAHIAFAKSLTHSLHQFSFQPGWGDFSSVIGHPSVYELPPSFGEGPIGMSMSNASIRNSWFFAVQVAHRLGYRRLYFIGCDFLDRRFDRCGAWAREFWELARAAGHEWVNLSPDSMLRFLPTECHV
jgi:hypothetical protein